MAHLLTVTSAYNILFMVPFPGPSHWLFMGKFIDELLDRGHQLTVVTSHPRKGPSNQNYTEVLMKPIYEFPSCEYLYSCFFRRLTFKFSVNINDILSKGPQSDFANLKTFWNHGLATTEHSLNDKKVKELIEMKNHTFDCFIMEQFFSEAFLMFGHKLNIPTITLTILPNSYHLDNLMGLSSPWSFNPHFILPYDDQMTFKEKTHNAIITIYDILYRNLVYMPRMQKLAEEHFKGHMSKIPLVSSLERKVSLILINSHRAIDSPRPTISGLVNIGGAHIRQPMPLPEDLKEFIESAEHGVIYFSLGAFLRSSDLPKEKLETIFKVLGKLKQKILWKFEDENMKGLPKNVLVKKWMPQNDILANKNVVLFVTHGGRSGLLEGVYWGKPMLCCPLFGDQHSNVEKLRRKGLGLSLDLSSFTEEEIEEKIKLLLSPVYAKKSKETSAVFQDNPIHPMEEAVYWIEYVIRHKGAPFMKSKAVNMDAIEYGLWDVFLLHLALIVFTAFVMVSFVWVVCIGYGRWFYVRGKEGTLMKRE